MKRKYHKWTEAERKAVKEFVMFTNHPWSRYEQYELAQELSLPLEAVRGAVGRMIRDLRKERR